MKRQNNSPTRNTARDKGKKKNRSSFKDNVTEKKLDKAIELTFPASDPVAITQPAPDKEIRNEAKQEANKQEPTEQEKSTGK